MRAAPRIAAGLTSQALLLLGTVGSEAGAQAGDLDREVERLAPRGARGRHGQRDQREDESASHAALREQRQAEGRDHGHPEQARPSQSSQHVSDLLVHVT